MRAAFSPLSLLPGRARPLCQRSSLFSCRSDRVDEINFELPSISIHSALPIAPQLYYLPDQTQSRHQTRHASTIHTSTSIKGVQMSIGSATWQLLFVAYEDDMVCMVTHTPLAFTYILHKPSGNRCRFRASSDNEYKMRKTGSPIGPDSVIVRRCNYLLDNLHPSMPNSLLAAEEPRKTHSASSRVFRLGVWINRRSGVELLAV